MSSERTIYPTWQSEKNYVGIGCRNSLKRIYFLSAKETVSQRGGIDVAPRREWHCIAKELRSVYGDLAKGLHRINGRD